ncbi:epidermal growth factor receptor kinase substrate 8-like protein 3b isoform X1 [Pleuronectes platessa]|uniref:epidermal growth factor receptor kinase substrate 8-like protein 3b isoform X1 n=1 Tax=Pleuronectes platessa TaxID=8262 RepID=UPI00232A6AF1|nr:epidermal growth factor receptor kinase substrate 8-like protein 3b isoform X1 [Pleuronectes platessa]XP_053281091.1 epidermal growth factor receptor kinase substrate 8-like protein 3b isoform X1 [Pleuronectes platessa]XP_053281093.1 epidermal growth factor receptor kinase substrate 8-like protein 3b isoform X1 [Pleuronectes platessa]
MYGNNAPFSYSPRAVLQEDPPLQRSFFQQDDDLRGSPLQGNSLTRPSGKSIYMQRKEYSETLTKQRDNFHVRVEHLLTCELDGKEVNKVDDCLAKLKWLDTKGRLWGQEMIMDVHGRHLTLSDIETKTELEVLPLRSITQTRAILDSCAYSSLLTITVQDHSKRILQVFMFQCDEITADLLKADLDKALQKRGDDVEPRRDQSDIRNNLENIIRQQSFQQRRSPDMNLPPPEQPLTRWRNREPESTPPSWDYTQEEMLPHPDLYDLQSSPELQSEQREAEWNTEIFNHVLDDLEIFMDKLSDAPNSMRKDRKSKRAESAVSLPPREEYISCLQKIRYGFNLLGQLDGALTNPNAADYVHILFNSLSMIIPRYPADLVPAVVWPQLTEAALQLMGEEVNPKEGRLWNSLGDSWNVSRSRGVHDNTPPYIPEFYDGWRPQVSRSSSQRIPPVRPISSNFSESPLTMQAINNFTARNNRELSIMKGDMVQVIQKSKQWWLVCNARNEQGNVPMNVLEPIGGAREDVLQETRGPVIMDMNSSPAEVRAWLQSRGFSKITVTSLGVLTGSLLLGMTKDDIRTVCPEEGARVFFQLQAIKSAIALASEPSGPYNGRY